MQRLPNLGGLNLRLRAKTGADQDEDDNDDARRVRPRLSLLGEDQLVRIQQFLDYAIQSHLGLDETDPAPPEAERNRLIDDVKRRVAERYGSLTGEWPDRLGDDEGLEMFPAGVALTAEMLVNKLIALWTQGFNALDAERQSERRQIDEQIKRQLKQAELREADAADDRGYFDGRQLDGSEVPVADPELKAELKKKVNPGEERDWARELQAAGYPDKCCTGAWRCL